MDHYDAATVVVAVVGRPHGVHGEVLFRPYNVGGSAFDDVNSVILDRDGERRTYVVESLRGAAGALIARLSGVDTREAAAALTHALVRLPRQALPPLAPGEYYVEDVVGCAVFAENGAPLGTAMGTFWSGAHDIMTVVEGQGVDGGAGRERLIPLVAAVVLEVDVPGRKIRVAWEDDDE